MHYVAKERVKILYAVCCSVLIMTMNVRQSVMEVTHLRCAKKCLLRWCKEQRVCTCMREYNHNMIIHACVAACDGISNPNSQCRSGKCEDKEEGGDDCICTREYDPLCCAGVDYSSPCVERCDDDAHDKLCK
eukprot:845326_1